MPEPTTNVADADYSARGTIFTPADAVRAGAAQLKTFLDTCPGLCHQDRLVDKVCSGFTLTASRHGGQKSTLPALYNCVYHLVPSKAA